LTDVFVIGSPRSGTTWLQALLAGHPDLASPPELHLFSSYLAPVETRWNDHVRLSRIEREAGKPDPGGGLQNVLDRAEFVEWMRDLYRRVRDGALSLKPGATRLLEKTPSNARHLPLIREIAPGARFVHIVRDPRDVVASLLERSRRPFGNWAPSDVCSATAVWRTHVSAALRDAASVDTLVTRYEHLEADPHPELQVITDFLGLPGPVERWLDGDLDARSLERARRVTVRKNEADVRDAEFRTVPVDVLHAPTTRPLSELERWYVESQCFAEMRELGYQPTVFEPRRPSPRRRIEVLVRIRAPLVARSVGGRAGRSLAARRRARRPRL